MISLILQSTSHHVPAPHVCAQTFLLPYLPRSPSVTLSTLTGTVTDHTGKPLRGVYVSIPGSDQRFTITGSDGRYTLYGPAHRRYTVNYYKEGYKAARQAVVLKAGRVSSILRVR